MRKAITAALMLAAVLGAKAQTLPVEWDMDKYTQVPASKPLHKMDTCGVKAVIIDGVDYKGEKTQFFAYYGIPENADAEQPVPAMILVHGGGGTAYWNWVKAWVDRGYAAISMDTTGRIPIRYEGDPLEVGWINWLSLRGGLNIEWGDYARADRTPEEQWAFCAVADVAIAHTFLTSLEGVDPERVGITGNSWGGYLSILCPAVDHRYVFTAPVYASGFYSITRMSGEKSSGTELWNKWTDLWDAQHYVPSIEVPIVWITGAKDGCFDFPAHQKTMLISEMPQYRSIKTELVHTDGAYMMPEEAFAMADHFLKGGKAMPVLGIPEIGKRNTASCSVESGKEQVSTALLAYTLDSENIWMDKEWQTATLWTRGQKRAPQEVPEKLKATVPEGAVAWYFIVITDEGLTASSPAVF